MKIFHIYFFWCGNLIANVFAYYKQCYPEFSVCLITNTDNPASESKYRLSQSSAEDWCKQESSSLSIITDENIRSALEAFFVDSSANLDSDIITNGFRHNQTFWRWTNNVRAAISGFDHDYGYGFMDISSGRFDVSNDLRATSKRKFICSYASYNYSCPDGVKQFGRKCYKIHNKEVTWFDARNTCLKEVGGDFATFENGVPSLSLERNKEYWIGLRREKWTWRSNGTLLDLKFSNWEDEKPSSTGGNCLCLTTKAGRWKNCDCSQKYRYICSQDYTSGSASAITTATTETSSTLTTTDSTLAAIPSVGDSVSRFHSTSTELGLGLQGDNFSGKASGMPEGLLLGLGVGSGCLLILIIVIVVIVCIKNRRSRSSDHEPTHGNSPPPMTYKDDAPNTVYALVVPNDDEPVRSPSEKTPNQTVYAELDLEPKGKITRRASQPVRYPSERTPDQSVYAEVDLLPKRKTLGRDVGQQESEVYANSLQVDSVYANNAQTKV